MKNLQEQIRRIIKEELITESVKIYDAEISAVPIDWSKNKHSGQLKIYFPKTKESYYYKLTVKSFWYTGNVLVKSLYKDVDEKNNYRVVTSENQKFDISWNDLNSVYEKAKDELRKFTIKGDADITFSLV